MPRGRRRGHIKPQNFAAVIAAFLNSPKWESYSAGTKRTLRRQLVLAQRPELLGDVHTDQIRPALVQAVLDGLAHLPGKQANMKAALLAVEKWSLVRDLLPYPIMTGTETVGSDGSHEPWTDAQVDTAERHARPMLSLAVTLAANTGQRGSDLVKMRWSDIEAYKGTSGINVVQRKTGRRLWIPFTPALETRLSQEERHPGFILGSQRGGGLASLSHLWQRERDHNPALSEHKALALTLHGLRAAAVIRLRRKGASESQIADMVGMSLSMVQRYCRRADQRDSALAALEMLGVATVLPFPTKKPM